MSSAKSPRSMEPPRLTSAWITGETYAEFARVVRPNGAIVCAIGDERFRDGRFDEVTRRLSAQGRLETLERGPERRDLLIKVVLLIVQFG